MKLKTLAQTKVYPDFPSIGGEDSAEMLEVLLKDIADAQKSIRVVKESFKNHSGS